MKFSAVEFLEFEKRRKEEAHELDEGLNLKHATAEDKKTFQSRTVVYRIELPDMPAEKTVLLFNRWAQFLRRESLKNENLAAIIGLSEHKKWCPYCLEYGNKGGHPKKKFSAQKSYQTRPHIHVNVTGKGARTVTEKLYRNLSRKIALQPYDRVVFSQRYVCRNYIAWQSTLYREFGNIDDYLIDEEDDPIAF